MVAHAVAASPRPRRDPPVSALPAVGVGPCCNVRASAEAETDAGDRAAGYAFLVPFWSNELGGEVCEIDELYVLPERRREGIGSALFAAIDAGLFGAFAATALGVIPSKRVTPSNARARRLYERLRFRAAGTTMVRRRAGPGAAGSF
jgi:GNAT superfamily N-acetyltransferase